MSDSMNATAAVLPFTAQGAAKQATNSAGADIRQAYGSNFPPVIDCTADLCLPTTIAANSTWTSPVLPALGAVHTSFAGTLSQNGQVVLSRYADTLGKILVSSVTAAMTASVGAVLDSSASVLFQAFAYSMSNSSGSAATLSSAIALLGSK